MIVVVPVDPLHGGSLESLADETALSPVETTALSEAATVDVVRAVAHSGGELLVNYRDGNDESDGDAGKAGANEDEDTDTDAEAAARALVVEALGTTTDVRFERQVGSTPSARVGNTVTHLLAREDHASVGVLEPTAPLVTRTEIDGAAMSIRRSDVVLGPDPRGDVYFSCFADPIDFTDAYATPALSRIARRAADDGLGIGFTPMVPTIETETGLCSTVAGLEARRLAGRQVPEATAAIVEELELVVGDGPDGPTIGRE